MAFQKNNGNRRVETANCLHVKAKALVFMGKYSDAKPIFEQSTAMRRNLCGSDNILVGNSQYAVGKMFILMGNFDEARKFLLQAREIYVRTSQTFEEKCDLLDIRFYLAILDYLEGRVSNAIKQHFIILKDKMAHYQCEI